MSIKLGAVYRHKKRGTLYRVVNTNCYLQLTGDHDLERMVVYQEINTDMQWARLYSEFSDGRFELYLDTALAVQMVLDLARENVLSDAEAEQDTEALKPMQQLQRMAMTMTEEYINNLLGDA